MRKIFLSFFLIFTVVLTSGAGYMGSLPDIESEFSYLREEHSEKTQAPFSVEELDKKNEKKLKPVPRDNEDYVDIIIKKDKTTQYMKDMNSVIIILEKLRQCLNTNKDIQKFNAIVSNLIDNVEYIRVEYKDKPESNYFSYNQIQALSYLARETANFRTQGLACEKYTPYTSENNIYTKENLEEKLNTLLTKTNETLYILKNLD